MSTMKFTAWQDLDGNEIANAAYPPGLVLVKTQTIGTGVSSVTVSNAFSSSFEHYRVILHGGSGSAFTTLRLQMSGDTSGYYGAAFGASYSSGNAAGAGVNNGSQWDYAGYVGTNVSLTLSCDIFSPHTAGRTRIKSDWTYNSGSTAYSMFVGETTSTASRTGFVISPASGTMTGGTIRVYGYRN